MWFQVLCDSNKKWSYMVRVPVLHSASPPLCIQVPAAHLASQPWLLSIIYLLAMPTGAFTDNLRVGFFPPYQFSLLLQHGFSHSHWMGSHRLKITSFAMVFTGGGDAWHKGLSPQPLRDSPETEPELQFHTFIWCPSVYREAQDGK